VVPDAAQSRVSSTLGEDAVNTANPYAPPKGAVRDVDSGDSAEPADRGIRLVAAILDGIIAFAMIYLPALIVFITTDSISGAEQRPDDIVLAIAGGLAIIGAIVWIWLTIMYVARNGQTIAKKMLGIKVVRSDGSKASLGRIFWLRNIVNGLLGIIPLYSLIDHLFIFGEQRQCLHDKIADTIVVRA
jgi:uncharacterized RDD family membrane protein YckC